MFPFYIWIAWGLCRFNSITIHRSILQETSFLCPFQRVMWRHFTLAQGRGRGCWTLSRCVRYWSAVVWVWCWSVPPCPPTSAVPAPGSPHHYSPTDSSVAIPLSLVSSLLGLGETSKYNCCGPQCAAASHHWLLLEAKTIVFKID